MKIGVLLPAYNEEKNIKDVIKETKKVLPKADILVVDDGSKDKTFEIAKKERVHVIRHEKNRGKGEALKTGFKYFRKRVDAVIVVDADRQYPVEYVVDFLNALKDADYVTGYRIPRDMPYANRIGNFIWKKAFNILFGINLKDTNCGYVGLNKKAMVKIKNIYGGYIIENAMMVDVIKGGLKIKQVPVSVKYGKRNISKFARMFFGVLVYILKEGFKYRLQKVKI